MHFALLAALLLGAPARGETLDGLLARVTQAYGGKKPIARWQAVRETGTLESPRGVAKTVRLFAAPDRLRVEIHYPGGGGEVRLLAGPHAWRDGEMVQGPPRDAMLLQAARLDLPGLLLRNPARLVDLGVILVDGKSLRGIGVPLDGNLQLAVGVDPNTGLILHSEGQIPSPGGPVRFATTYQDFRPVKGVLFAFRESNFASGQLTGRTRLETIELLDAAPPGAFAP